MEQFHIRYCKYVLGVGNHCSNVTALAECGRNYFVVENATRVIKY